MVKQRHHYKLMQLRRWNELSSYPEGAPTDDAAYDHYFSDDQWISGGNHAVHANVPLGPNSGDLGGDFWVVRRFYDEFSTLPRGDSDFSWSTNPSQNGSPHFTGRQYPWRYWFGNEHFPVAEGRSVNELNALGTTAIARCAPTKPEADIATFIGELREGIPSAVLLHQNGKSRARQARNAGDEYLNVEFGWKPLIRDVQSFAKAVRDSDKILRDYHEGSGKLIKRRYSWPDELTVDVEDWGLNYPMPLLPTALYGTNGRGRLTRTVSRKVETWFTGSFMYFCPPPETPDRWLSDANRLLGVKPTPETLWNIAPWSWAADWVGNTGDIASNLSYLQSDALAIHHAYIMERVTVTHEYTLQGDQIWKTYPGHHRLTQRFTTVNKRRIRATPYGFGLNWDEFNSKQLGILAALGISRAK